MELAFLKLWILKKNIKYYCNFNWNNKEFVNRLEKNEHYRGVNLGAKSGRVYIYTKWWEAMWLF